MDFQAFDTKKLDEYAARAKASWGATPEYGEFERKAQGRTKQEDSALAERMMHIFAEFGAIREGDPASEDAQTLVRKLREFISEHYFTCSDTILSSLGRMYAGGGEFTDNIDRYGGEGTGEFVYRAIRVSCGE